MILQRKSNMELLRIISMFMILLLHANFYTFKAPTDIGVQSFLRIATQSATIIGVNLFVLITGYFGTSFKLTKIFGLIFQVLFAVVPVTIILYIIG